MNPGLSVPIPTFFPDSRKSAGNPTEVATRIHTVQNCVTLIHTEKKTMLERQSITWHHNFFSVQSVFGIRCLVFSVQCVYWYSWLYFDLDRTCVFRKNFNFNFHRLDFCLWRFAHFSSKRFIPLEFVIVWKPSNDCDRCMRFLCCDKAILNVGAV